MHAFSAIDHCLRPFEPPIGIINAPIRSVEGVSCDNVGCQCSIRLERVYRFTSFPVSLESRAELLNEFADERLHTSNGLLREERVQSTSTESMKVMRCR